MEKRTTPAPAAPSSKGNGGIKSSIFEWLLIMGVGICIISLIIMVSSMVNKIPKKKEKTPQNDLHIFPHLFDEPLVLLERSKKSIKSLDQEILTLKNKLKNYNKKLEITCNNYNKKISNINSHAEFNESYNKYINDCKNEGCIINKSLDFMSGNCTSDDPQNNKACTTSYFKNYTSKIENITSVKNACDKNGAAAGLGCKFISQIPQGYDEASKDYTDVTGKIENTDLAGEASKDYTDVTDKMENTDLAGEASKDYTDFTDKMENTDLAGEMRSKYTTLKNKYSSDNNNDVNKDGKLIEGQVYGVPVSTPAPTTLTPKKVCIVETIQDIQKKLEKKQEEKNKLIEYKILLG